MLLHSLASRTAAVIEGGTKQEKTIVWAPSTISRRYLGGLGSHGATHPSPQTHVRGLPLNRRCAAKQLQSGAEMPKHFRPAEVQDRSDP